MKVLLVNPAPDFYSGTASASAPLGLLSIATYLNRNGHEVRIYDRTIRHASLDKALNGFCPEVVGVSLISFKPINDAIKISAACKKKNMTVVWGGQMASLLIENVLDTGVVDYISIGEGEQTWLELLNALEKGVAADDIAGLAFMRDGKLVKTRDREFLDLSLLSVTDWSLVDINNYFQSSFGCKKMMYICSSKGCIGNCSFCINESFNRCTYRRRPVNIVMDEIEYLVKNYNLDGVYYAAELFCKNSSEVYELCEERKRRGLSFVWGCQTRIGVFSDGDFKYMYDNGCRWMFFGIESGSQRMLDSVSKHINLSLVKKTFSLCAQAGITAIAAFIVGFENETKQDIQQTIDLALSLDSAMYSFSCMAPCPGSRFLESVQKNKGYVPPKKLTDYTVIKYIDRPEPNFSNLPSKDIIVIRDYFQWLSFISPPKKKNDGKTSLFAVKVIADALKSAASNGFTGFIGYGLSAVGKFVSTVAHVYLHPRIRKKYHLYKR